MRERLPQTDQSVAAYRLLTRAARIRSLKRVVGGVSVGASNRNATAGRLDRNVGGAAPQPGSVRLY